MRKRYWSLLLAPVMGIASWLWLRPAFSQAPGVTQPGASAASVLLWFGVTAAGPEIWDGSATVTGGKLVNTIGRHFSQGDEVTGAGQWKAKTRRDEVALWSDIHYTEMRPGSVPPVYHRPIGVVLQVEGEGARANVQTQQGSFQFGLNELGPDPTPVLGGKAHVQRIPTPEKLTAGEYEDDEPSIAALPGGGIAVAWVAYKNQADRVMMRTRTAEGWTSAEQVSERPGDIFKTSMAATPDGALWVFWSERAGRQWTLWGRSKNGSAWSAPVRVSSGGSATFHKAASSANGSVFAVWQNFQGGPSDIMLREWRNGTWQPEVKVSESPANDWEPAVAAASDGTAYVVWDSYDKGNYDIRIRSYKDGRMSNEYPLTNSPRFQAHASVAVDAQGRPWVAWNESGVNWGKDQGFLIPTPLATPLHQERRLKVVYREGNRWMEPAGLNDAMPPDMRAKAEHPLMAFSSTGGGLTLVLRHWTRRVSRQIGSVIVWENYAMTFDGRKWTAPRPLLDSGSWIEKIAALAVSSSGEIWSAWMTDNRPFTTMIPVNGDISAGLLGKPAPMAAVQSNPFAEPFEEAIPVHTNDAADVKAIRTYAIESGGKKYRIWRGDMHRHTDISQDFKYDGSLFEVYRYALDAAGFDYIAPTDHQTGYDQEFSWWQHEKYVDLFLVPGSFTPIFGYERSLRFPNGHRNVIRPQRGVRPLPIPPDEASGKEGAKQLFAHLKATGAISMPHSMATAQGTNWRDNDPEVEPLVEIYQGYRASYEYEGAPKAATELNQHAQKSGWEPSGFYWNALAKGYKLGVQASSDHWSTHISYACLLVEGDTRESMMDAIRKRHAYAATDNIILDFRATAGGKEYIQGDALESQTAPTLLVTVQGTNPIKQIDVMKDKTFLYTTRPQSKNARFSFTDSRKGAGESWYYVRVLQEDGQIAWSSPIWVKK